MGVGEFLIWSGVLGLIFYALFNIFKMVDWCLKQSALHEELISTDIAPNEFDTSDFENIR